ncbi:MAG TPA: hypothetical protein VJ936_00225 [Desulfobacteraceae bacterium]|nr:hypothetical protein [Desulfobacteraceae bacterium]
MTGIQEILTLIMIIAGIVVLPRIFGKRDPAGGKKKKNVPLSGKIRMGIVLSILLPAVAALVIKPWQQDLTLFTLLGVLPVAAGWAAFWIRSGFKRTGPGKSRPCR